MIPYTSIPLISACFLVMVGILIGHLIWYRYRDEQEQKAADLHRQIDGLRSSLNVQTHDTAESRVRLSEIEGMRATERDAAAELQARLESNETLYESAAADLEKTEQVNQQLRQQVAQQEQELGKFRSYAEQASSKIGQLENQLSHQSGKLSEEIQGVRGQLRSALEAHEAINLQLSQRDIQIADLENSSRTWQEHADSANAEVTRLSELLQRQDTLLAEQSHELEDASALRHDRDRLQVTLKQTQDQLEILRDESSKSNHRLSDQVAELTRSNAELARSESEYAEQLEAQVELSDDLSAKIEAALLDLERLNERADELHAVKVDRDRLIEELDERQDEIKRLTHELDTAALAAADSRQRLEQLQQHCDVLEAELEQTSSRDQQTSDQLRVEEQRRQSLERALAAASEEVAQLHVERERLEGIEDEFVELDNSRRQLVKQLELAKRERDEALGAESSTREIVVELRDELADRLESVQQLEDQRNEAVAQTEKERTQRFAACSEVDAANQQLEQLKAQRHSLQQQHDEKIKESDRLKAELETAKTLYGQVVDQITMYRQEVHGAQNGGANHVQREVVGKRTHRSLESARPAKSGFSFRRAQRREEDVRAREKANTYRDQRLGTVYSAAPLRCDDLTQIQGVGRESQSQLNSLGIYTFKQVMEWNAQVTAEFAQRLATDRIVKDDWIGQARRLYHRHYPAAA